LSSLCPILDKKTLETHILKIFEASLGFLIQEMASVMTGSASQLEQGPPFEDHH